MRKFVRKEQLNKVSGNLFRKWAEWAEEDFIVGKYLGSKLDQYGNPSYTIEVVNCEFQDKTAQFKEGVTMCLNSNGMLDKAIEGVEVGEYIEVVYKGNSKISKGPYKGTMSHLVELSTVELEDEDEESIDV